MATSQNPKQLTAKDYRDEYQAALDLAQTDWKKAKLDISKWIQKVKTRAVGILFFSALNLLNKGDTDKQEFKLLMASLSSIRDQSKNEKAKVEASKAYDNLICKSLETTQLELRVVKSNLRELNEAVDSKADKQDTEVRWQQEQNILFCDHSRTHSHSLTLHVHHPY